MFGKKMIASAYLAKQMQAFLDERNAEGLLAYMQRLSNAARRSADALLGERLLIDVEEEAFWLFFSEMVRRAPKAYLGTFLKAAAARLPKGQLNAANPLFLKFAAEEATPIDRTKCLDALLPLIKQPEDAERVLDAFFCKEQKSAPGRALALLKVPTDACNYLLFKTMKQTDDLVLVRKVCLRLLQRGGSASFNLAGILAGYFGIQSLPAAFSLKIEPYQYSHLEESYGNFLKYLRQ